MTVAQELQKLAPTALIELFELDLLPDDPASTQKVYFHAGTNKLQSKVVWQGIEYFALPVQASGFDRQASGALPRVTLRLANADGAFSSIINDLDELLASRLTRRRTFARFLDAVNFPEGNPEANPGAYLPSDIFYLERKASESVSAIELEFTSRFDVEGVMLPRRQVLSNSCNWRYRGAECGYTGRCVASASDALITPSASVVAPFNEWNSGATYTSGAAVWLTSPTNVWAAIAASTGVKPGTDPTKWVQDVCGKRLSSCKLRFGTGAQSILPFGAFPGSARV